MLMFFSSFVQPSIFCISYGMPYDSLMFNIAAMDISTDLTELGRTPVTVVSAGIKSILDIGHTLEYLVRVCHVDTHRRSQDFCCGGALHCCLKYLPPFPPFLVVIVLNYAKYSLKLQKCLLVSFKRGALTTYPPPKLSPQFLFLALKIAHLHPLHPLATPM